MLTRSVVSSCVTNSAESGQWLQVKSLFGRFRSESMHLMSRILIKLQPRASKDELLGWDGDETLRVRVKAPPVDGAANTALIELLSKELRVAKRQVSIVSGAGTRNKVVEFAGISESEVRQVLRRPGSRKK